MALTLADVLARVAATGRHGPVRDGAWLDDVRAVFGDPVDAGPITGRRRWSHRCFYGDLEFAVCRCGWVHVVTFQPARDPVELPDAVTGEPVTYRGGGIGRAEMEAALERAGCGWEPDDRPALRAYQRDFVVPGTGVRFVFAVLGQAGADRQTEADGAGPALELAKVSLRGEPGHDCGTRA
ncbi:hypothetical protein [Streptomyces sp. NPDC002644]